MCVKNCKGIFVFQLIYKVLTFLKREAEEGEPVIPLLNYKERLIAATGISESTYKRILKEGQTVEAAEKPSFSTPHKKRPRISSKSAIPEHEEEEVRRIVNNFYLIEKRRPTLNGVFLKLQECNVPFEGGISSLRVLLKKIGFR